MSETKLKQGGTGEDAPRCPPHPGFVFGLCLLCGAKEEAESGAPPAVAVAHETTKQGGDGDGDGDAASCPPHPGFVDGLCSRCGAEEEAEAGGGAPLGVALGYQVTNQGGGDDDDDDFVDDEVAGPSGSRDGVTVAYHDGEGPELPDLEAATSIVSASDRATLMRERKLVLVLDLDLTLLNSTKINDLSPDEKLNGITPDTIGDPDIDLFRLEMDSDEVDMLVKLRPFAGGFLEEASAMFELHVYTLGTRRYANAVIGRLDPDGVYIGGRIVSRDESAWENAKLLDVIEGAEAVTVVILDDTEAAWPENQDNLILMDRYRYFASTCRKYGRGLRSLAELDMDEAEQDCPLALVLGVLKRVHKGFFDGDRADVREVIAEVRRQVLPGCTVAFSYLEQSMEDSPEDTPVWALAERLGAVCRKDVDETVTHVVAEDPGTQKAQWARDHGKFLVTPAWIKAASFRWRREDELAFPVTTRAS